LILSTEHSERSEESSLKAPHKSFVLFRMTKRHVLKNSYSGARAPLCLV